MALSLTRPNFESPIKGIRDALNLSPHCRQSGLTTIFQYSASSAEYSSLDRLQTRYQWALVDPKLESFWGLIVISIRSKQYAYGSLQELERSAAFYHVCAGRCFR
jgi:hypothetical protein